MVSKTVLGIAAGVAGTLFIGYCIYFDKKRRNHPEFRKKLKERRRKAKQPKRAGVQLPDFKDQESMQRFFLQEIQAGENLLAEGNFEEAVEHLSNGIAVCGQPQQLLNVLQQTLPPQVFHMLLERLPVVSANITRTASSSAMLEEDVE